MKCCYSCAVINGKKSHNGTFVLLKGALKTELCGEAEHGKTTTYQILSFKYLIQQGYMQHWMYAKKIRLNLVSQSCIYIDQ